MCTSDAKRSRMGVGGRNEANDIRNKFNNVLKDSPVLHSTLILHRLCLDVSSSCTGSWCQVQQPGNQSPRRPANSLSAWRAMRPASPQSSSPEDIVVMGDCRGCWGESSLPMVGFRIRTDQEGAEKFQTKVVSQMWPKSSLSTWKPSLLALMDLAVRVQWFRETEVSAGGVRLAVAVAARGGRVEPLSLSSPMQPPT